MSHQQEWFSYILNTQWITVGANQVVHPERHEDGTWIIGDIHTNDADILKARPDYQNVNDISEFSLLHNDWHVALLKRYRPIIYFAAFGHEAILECTILAVQSLIEFGKWQHEIIILTSEDNKQLFIQRLSSLLLENKLHIITSVPSEQKLDWYTARYRIHAHPLFKQAQPLLYLDTDILCNAPIESLFLETIDSPFIHACKEGIINEGSSESSGHWYGWRLMQQDNVPCNPYSRGFSSGALLFSNVNIATPYFNMILQATYGYTHKHGHDGGSYDQRYANYVLFKFHKAEINKMDQWLDLYRIPLNTHIIPDIKHRLGFVHFLNVSTKDKLVTMQLYMEAIRLHDSNSDPVNNPYKISTLLT